MHFPEVFTTFHASLQAKGSVECVCVPILCTMLRLSYSSLNIHQLKLVTHISIFEQSNETYFSVKLFISSSGDAGAKMIAMCMDNLSRSQVLSFRRNLGQ